MRVLFATEKCILSAAKLLTHPKKSRPSSMTRDFEVVMSMKVFGHWRKASTDILCSV